MSKQEIEVFRVAETKVNGEEVRRWLNFLEVDDQDIDSLLDPDAGIADPALLVAVAAKRCYKSFSVGLNPNVTRIRRNMAEYLDNILNSGHGSVLEHGVYTYAVENVSRVFTAEMNRHRAGWAISEQSLRFVRFAEDVPYWEPMSFRGDDVLFAGDADKLVTGLMQDVMDLPENARTVEYDDNMIRKELSLDQRKHLSRVLFERAFKSQQHFYEALLRVWDMDDTDKNFSYKKKVTSALRRIIGMGVCTGGVWSGNIRALRHVITMRCSPAAEEEICYVFNLVLKDLMECNPELFGDFYQDDEGFWRPDYVKV